ILQPVIEHPLIGWKINLPSRFCVGQQPVALKSGSVAEHCAELPGGSFQAAHGCVCKLGWIDILAGKDLQSLPDAFDARASLLGGAWHGYAAVRIEWTETYPRLRVSGGNVDDRGVTLAALERFGGTAVAGDGVWHAGSF
ncbi:MAG TPA: hypothetical protein VKE41_19125, partial [Roseiflexaceae bacterium]|nr:hypothetical protein [Roseiflexaceae bacterium]